MSFTPGQGSSPQLLIVLVVIAVFLGILAGWWLFSAMTVPVPAG